MKSYLVFTEVCIFIILISLFYTTCSGQDYDTSFDFRKTRWGMTKNEVKASETMELPKELKVDANGTNSYGPNETIIYIGKIASKEVQIIYAFLNNHLINAMQLFTEQYEDKTLYIEAYDMHKVTLTEKYLS